MTQSNKTIIENYWKIVNSRDWTGFEALVTEDVVYDLPQTRERVRGKKAFRAFNENYPGNWTVSIVDLVADEHQAVSQIAFTGNGKEQTGISFFDIRDGLIHGIREFWPSPYEPPLRYADDIERY